MPSYKFYYWNVRGLGEPIRLILNFKGQKFEDVRLESLDVIRERSDEFPFGKVPVLELENGTKIPQSLAIASYLGKELNLSGKDNVEAALIESIGLLFMDFHIAVRPFTRVVAGYEQGDVQILTGTVLIPGIEQFMPMFEKLLTQSGSGYFAKSGISWVDFFICELVNSMNGMMPEVMGKYKALSEFVDRVYGLPSLQEYLKSRPQTKF